jgi:CheY-specific phosphatase CheX
MTMSTEFPPLRGEIADVVEQVTLIYRGVGARPAPDDASHSMEQPWTGCIAIDGAFKGTVTLTCPKQFAFDLARKMLDMSEEETTEEAARDALAELTNVVGGNVKSLISSLIGDTCRLTLPIVALGDLHVAGGRLREEVWFRCGDDVIVVGVIEVTDRLPRGLA